MNDEIVMQSSSSFSSGVVNQSSSSAGHYVSDDATSPTNYSDVTVKVMTSSGHEQHISVSKDITVRKLKQLCIPKYIEEKRLSDFATGEFGSFMF